MFSIGELSETWARQSRMNTFYKAETASTNDWAKNEVFLKAAEDSPISLYLTDFQPKGRGRGSNQWTPPPAGQALLSSWIFELSKPARPVVTCRIGLGVFRALNATWPWLKLALKAPNDIYLGPKKLGGILVESLQQGPRQALIIGLGLNIFGKPDLAIAESLLAVLKDENLISAMDWHVFLDRLFLELSLAVSMSSEQLGPTECQALLTALNSKVDLVENFSQVEPDGSLLIGPKKLHWMDL